MSYLSDAGRTPSGGVAAGDVSRGVRAGDRFGIWLKCSLCG